MLDLLAWPMPFRITYLRDFWQRLAREADGRPIALYGAGLHTQSLFNIVMDKVDGPRVAFILDDAEISVKDVRGIPVRRPENASPSDVAMVVVSSDSIEPKLAARAQKWAASSPNTPPRVVRPYADDNIPEIESHIQRTKHTWGMTRTDRNGHLPLAPDAKILRLPHVPERAPNAPLPVAPAELRAGYAAGDDAYYLASGARDVAAIREMISRNAPDAPPLRRVLDWGCSSGRMVRHWLDIVQSGGEVWGCDICATSLNCASEHLAPPFKFFQATTRPSLPLPDSSMDLIYANSVFTHIRDLFDAWLMELRRIVRPGGFVWASILDETWWETAGKQSSNSLRHRCPEIDFTQPMTDDFVCYGESFDPVTFWHTRGVRRRWSFAFDVIAIEPGTVPYQTGVLLRRPMQ